MFLPTASEFSSVFFQYLGAIALIGVVAVPAVWFAWNAFAGLIFPIAFLIAGRAVPSLTLWRYSRELASRLLAFVASTSCRFLAIYVCVITLGHGFSQEFWAWSIVGNVMWVAMQLVCCFVIVYVVATFGLSLLIHWCSWPKLARGEAGQWEVQYGIPWGTKSPAP